MISVEVNALAVPSFRQGGAGFYTATLLDGLSRAEGVRAHGLLSEELEAERRVLAPEAHSVVLRRRPRSRAAKLANYLASARRPDRLDLGFAGDAGLADVVHWPISFMNAPAPPPGARRVLTVLDIQHEFLPEHFSRRDRVLRRLRWAPSARAADHVIAISEFTRRTVCDRYGMPEEHVTAVPLCLRRSFLEDGEPGPLPPQLADGGAWFLYPASPLGAKNHARLLDGLRLHRDREDPDARLVLTGPRLHAWDSVRALVAERGLGDAVVFLGHVDDRTLRALYAAADGLVFPSLFEGFGLPVLEAMACGCPVAASTAGSLPEVIGDAGHAFDPRDTEAIAGAFAQLSGLSDRERREVGDAGRRQADRFGPERMVARTVDVYRKVTA